MAPGYRLLQAIGVPDFVRAVYRVEIGGGERIPASGPGIIVANHESMADPFVLGAATERTIHYMAKAELWSTPLLARAMDALGAFPVDRGTGDSSALGRGAELLAGGHLLGIFPQGTQLAFRRRPFHRGAAKLALVSGAPLLPVCLVGTARMLPTRNRRGFGLPRVRVLVAPPIRVARERPTIASARALTRRIEEAIQELGRPYGPPAHAWLD